MPDQLLIGVGRFVDMELVEVRGCVIGRKSGPIAPSNEGNVRSISPPLVAGGDPGGPEPNMDVSFKKS